MSISECAACGGKRLKPEVLAVTVGGLNILEFCEIILLVKVVRKLNLFNLL